jgi:sugar phosphate isomerase/epimerase
MPFAGLVEEPARFIEVAGILGAGPLMIPSFLPPQLRPSDVDGWKRIGAALGRGAETAKAAGLRVAWHNHEFEFRLLPDGSRPIDHMLSEAGEDLGLELDFAWVARGWADPEAELRRFAARVVAIQLKDTARPGTLDDENGWRATGDGIIDWDRLWPLFATTRADHLVVEHDRPRDWRTVARRSYDFARARMAAAGAAA